MTVTTNQRGVLQIDDCRIIFRNFAGEEDQYNRAGDRNFALVIPDEELAKQLTDDGWNVKIKPSRVEGELPLMFLPVKVTFSERSGPACYIDSNGTRVQLDATTVHRLDRIDAYRIDMDVRPYDWGPITGKYGRTAYLSAICMYANVDRFNRVSEGEY